MSDFAVVWGVLITVIAAVAVVVAIWFSRNRHVTYQSDGLIEQMSRRLDELTLQVVELKLALSHYQVGNATLSAQLLREGLTPEWKPARGVQQTVDEEPLVRIYQLITEHFSIRQIDELAALAGIPPESYSGEERPSRALSLVQYAARHGLLEELVAACRRKQPRVKWPILSL